jgi:multicomponent Na+:H+ antiporter subunit D
MGLLPVYLFLVPFLAALLCAVTGALWRPLSRAIALVGMLVTAATAIWTNVAVARHGALHTYMGGWEPPVGIELMVDPLGAFVAAIVAIIGFAVILAAGASVERELTRRDTFFYAVAMLMISGLMGMTVTHDLFNMFVHLEVVSLSAYALTAAGGRGAPRAALRYLLIGSMGASLYLLGVGFVYAATGTLNMTDAAARLAEADPRLVLVAAVLIVVGLAVKMGLFPLHLWMPGAYSLAPMGGASLMAPLVTKVSAYALLRVLFWVFGAGLLREQAVLLNLLAWAGALAVIVGAVMALLQSDLWRLLAYSSISQMGIVAMGMGLANEAAMTGGILHIGNDALMKGALFLAATAMLMRFGVRRVDELWRLRGRSRWIPPVVVVSGLSLIGLPPMCGFFGKWYVLKGALEADRWALAAALILGSLATAAYVARLVEGMLFSKTPETAERPPARGVVLTLVISSLLALGVIAFGLLSGRVIDGLILPGLPAGL